MTEYRTLGRSGVKVSPPAPGTMMFGARGDTGHEDSIRVIHHVPSRSWTAGWARRRSG